MIRMNNSTTITQVVCAILFISFTFLYLYLYQAEVLMMAQHVLSGGSTSYQPLVGAVLITIVLSLLPLGIYALTHLRGYAHALVYFPSMLLLAVLTDPSEQIDKGFSFGSWSWLVPVLLVVYVLVILLTRMFPFQDDNGKEEGLRSPLLWVNLTQLLVMTLLVVLVSNHRDVFHYRMRMEALMMDGKYREALQVGMRSLETDSSLTMLRISCLEQTSQLGESLFYYPLVGGSEVMRPNGSSVRSMMWRYPKKRHSGDYVLTHHLLDKDLDKFVHAIGKYYQVDSVSVPRHFREALILYAHQRANPLIVYHDNVMDADFEDFQKVEKMFRDPVERANRLRDLYGNTYWYYYQYVR